MPRLAGRVADEFNAVVRIIQMFLQTGPDGNYTFSQMLFLIYSSDFASDMAMNRRADRRTTQKCGRLKALPSRSIPAGSPASGGPGGGKYFTCH